MSFWQLHEKKPTEHQNMFLLTQQFTEVGKHEWYLKKSHSQMCSTPAFYIQDIWVQTSVQTGYPDHDVSRFCQPFQANDSIVPKIRPRALPFISFPIHYSLIILCYIIWTEKTHISYVNKYLDNNFQHGQCCTWICNSLWIHLTNFHEKTQ